MKKLGCIFFALLVASCSGTKTVKSGAEPSGTPAAKVAAQPNLTRAQAEERFAQIQDVGYKLTFDLSRPEKTYRGTVQINFFAKNLERPVRIDFYDGRIQSLKVNSQVQSPNYNGQFLLLPAQNLVMGPNAVEIEYEHDYGDAGHGFSYFKDPEDQRVYLHTHLEPYFANYVFPCFDQPDLKATYQMEVLAPAPWTVVTSVRESNVKTQGENRLWSFPQSQKFSTYIWSLHAGPFKIWEKNFRIPLRLMVRQSLAKYVKTEEWFKPTEQGFDFYEKFFAYKYPYKKYDQLAMPEFTSGAMENVAAVTFSERYISRGPKSTKEKRGLAGVILHEMAHMWFGDLVTMKWWDDLWLNESFATYMASLSMHSNTIYKESWRDFYNAKVGAYWLDNSVVTHPIQSEVPDTEHALTNFDNITYGKGASVLKLVSFYLTPEKFRAGTQIYFKKFAGQNTVLNDFTDSLTAGSGQDLQAFKKLWLQTAGVNRIEAQWQCADDKISELKIHQTPPAEHPYLREQKLLVSLQAASGSEIKVYKTLPVIISSMDTLVPEANGLKCPTIVYPNHEDHGYARAYLDSARTRTFLEHPLAVKDAFLRQMMWGAAWDSVRDAQFPLKDFMSLGLANGLRVEKDDFVLDNIVRYFVGGASVMYYLSHSAPDIFQRQVDLISQTLWQRLTQAPGGSEEQKILFRGFVESARTDFGKQKLFALLQGQQKIPGYVIDQDRRWQMIGILADGNFSQAKNLIAAEKQKDPSFNGELGAIAGQVGLPDWDEKQKWIEEYKSEKPRHSQAQLRTALWNAFPLGQDQFREKYSSDFYADLLKVNKTKDSNAAGTFTALVPTDCGPQETDRIGPFLEQNKDLQPVIQKSLKIQREEFARCRKIVRGI